MKIRVSESQFSMCVSDMVLITERLYVTESIDMTPGPRAMTIKDKLSADANTYTVTSY
jgi:hypothetical protein